MALVIKSTAFAPNGAIPIKYTCEDEDASPALEWSGVPSGAKSLALIVDDPDAPDPAAPKMVYVHWVLYDIPPSANGLPEGMTSARLPKGAREAKNDFGRTGYGGPCPPIGRPVACPWPGTAPWLPKPSDRFEQSLRLRRRRLESPVSPRRHRR